MRIYLAAAREDYLRVKQISDELTTLGYTINIPKRVPATGDAITLQSQSQLREAEAMLVLWSKSSHVRLKMLMDVGYFTSASSDRPIVTVALDDTALPSDLLNHPVISDGERPVDEIAQEIAAILSIRQGQLTKEKEVAEERKEVVERSAEKYISESLKALENREQKYQRWAFACYSLGYLTIVLGLGITVYRVTRGSLLLHDVPTAIYTGVLTVSAIGFLAALARFAFVLGRSFMVEAIRNNDRTHAIKYGEFYLKAFGDKPNWSELKEAFQYWNVDSGSTFKEQKEDAIDPQILKSLVELAQTLKK